MSKLGLSYRGKNVQLFPGTEINWEVEDDLLDFSSIGAGFSWPISLPREGNEHIFHHAGDPDAADNLLRTYDGFHILVDGNQWWPVSFDLTDADEVRYEGTLSTVPNPLHQNKNRSIRKILENELTVSSVDDPAGNYVNPFIHFYNETYVDSTIQGKLLNAGRFLPCYKALYILRRCLQKIGMTLQDNFTTGTDDWSNLILIHNARVSKAFSGDFGHLFLPEMTLLDLINDLCLITGSTPAINVDDSTILEINNLTRVQDKKNIYSLDFEPSSPRVKNNPTESIRYSFASLSSDFILSRTVDVQQGTYKGEFATITSFAASLPSAEEYGYIKAENAYYKVLEYAGGAYIERYQEPFQDRQPANEGNNTEISIKSLPVSKQKYVYVEDDGDYEIVDNGSGKVRISGTIPQSIWTVSDHVSRDVTFIEAGDNTIYDMRDGFVDVTGMTATNIDTDITFDEAVKLRKIVVRFETPYYFPVIGASSYEYTDAKKESFTPRIAIYRPELTENDGAGTYDSASCDPYSYTGAQIGDYSIQWHQANSIYELIWKPLERFITYGRILSYVADLSADALKALVRYRKVATLRATFLFKSFRARITERGIEDQKIEGWRI